MGESITSLDDQAFMLRFLLLLPCLLSFAAAAPLPLAEAGRAAWVEDTPAATTVRGHPVQGTGLPPKGKEPGVPADTAPLATLRIDWLNQNPAPEDFEVAVTKERRIITSTHRLGQTGITRTILAAPDAFFLHFVADQPGAISFKASLSSSRAGKTTVHDRNELLWTAATDAPVKAFARVIPFESDVEVEGNSILLKGEGECLVIFSFTPFDTAEKPLSGTWQRLAATLDPGTEHPDPVKIWQTIFARAAAP